jgi:arylsulfatase A-like enzyme
VITASAPAAAQQQQKPNILFIMGYDIGRMQPSIYHQGLMVGETPNIDQIGQEGVTMSRACRKGPPCASLAINLNERRRSWPTSET